jgi:regulator of protease activity HflC (stomatin/prohibitin superfamily)
MDAATFWMVGIFLITTIMVVLYYTGALQHFLPVIIVDSQKAVIVDNRLGKDRVLTEGINRYLPWIEKIEGEITLKEQPVDPDPQTIITKDNISITVDMIAMIKVVDPLKAVMDVSDYQKAVNSLVQTGVVDIMGKMELKEIQTNLETISKKVLKHVEEDSSRWGVTITQVRFESISYSDEIKKAMEQITVSESKKKAMITEAEAKKQAAQLEAEALLHKIEILQKNMPDMSNEKILEFTRSLDYINSMKNLSSSENAKFVVYPSESGAAGQPPIDQIMSTEYITQSMNKK